MIIVAMVLGSTACLGGCTPIQDQAQRIVVQELGGNADVRFRKIRSKHSDRQIVCGEVNATKSDNSAWQSFIAFVPLRRAKLMPPAWLAAKAEQANPKLVEVGRQFRAECDG